MNLKPTKLYMFEYDPTPDSCWSLSAGPDGRIYASACVELLPGGGVTIVRYNEEKDCLDTVIDIAEAVGEPLTSGRATQCKVHYGFAASPGTGILYAATHLSAPGYGQLAYSPWADWKDDARAFPRSWLLAYDTRRDAVAWSSPFIPREGCRCLALDEERGRLYAISYPRDHFWIYDIKTRSIRDLGRLGSINSQGIFTDRRGRVFTSNGDGQIVRYSPDTDRLEELPVFLPVAPGRSSWHAVIYDVVASPGGDCVYGVPWDTNPRLFRYWPEDGPNGRMEDLGPVGQDRDPTAMVPFYLDHCGGLVFGADGCLYYALGRWPAGDESRPLSAEHVDTAGTVVRYDPSTGTRTDFARIGGRPGRTDSKGHYVSRAARDHAGNLYFGQVMRPLPEAGLSRLVMDAQPKGPAQGARAGGGAPCGRRGGRGSPQACQDLGVTEMSDDYSLQSVGEYVREGTMLALPLCFPGQTTPPPAGETAARVMEIDPNGTVYLGTGGTRAHVLAAMLRQDTGTVFDIGAVPEASSVDALAVVGKDLSFVASGPGGTALWRTGRISGAFMIQEWGITRPAMEKTAPIDVAGVAGAVTAADGRSIFLVVSGTGELVQVETQTGRVLSRHDTGGAGRFGRALVTDAAGRVWGSAGRAGLWVFSPATGALEKLGRPVPCSAGREQHTQVSAWSLDPVTGLLYGGTEPDGFLFTLDPGTREIVSLGKPARQEPITCLTVGNDGCLFGMAGGADDIGHLFRYEPARRSLEDLGIPVSTLTTRNYGYTFACARTGRDGEMYFGQSERVNQLWVYFPPIGGFRS